MPPRAKNQLLVRNFVFVVISSFQLKLQSCIRCQKLLFDAMEILQVHEALSAQRVCKYVLRTSTVISWRFLLVYQCTSVYWIGPRKHFFPPQYRPFHIRIKSKYWHKKNAFLIPHQEPAKNSDHGTIFLSRIMIGIVWWPFFAPGYAYYHPMEHIPW